MIEKRGNEVPSYLYVDKPILSARQWADLFQREGGREG
jgi:hypothetical protein